MTDANLGVLRRVRWILTGRGLGELGDNKGLKYDLAFYTGGGHFPSE